MCEHDVDEEKKFNNIKYVRKYIEISLFFFVFYIYLNLHL